MIFNLKAVLCLGASAVALGAGGVAAAQDSAVEQSSAVEEIVVTAQRRSQNAQDVPMTVTAVSAQELDELKLQRFEDVQRLSPGLQLDSTARITTSTLRGVSYNPDSSADPSIDTYFNEVPVDPSFMFQSIFDVQQIEVLRGPQGLQRGRPAPVGAITLTSRRPDMNEYGATLSSTFSEFDAMNLQVAVNVPIIDDKLAFRFAALYDETDNNGVRNYFTGDESHRITRGLRGTLAWRPTDALAVTLSHNHLRTKSVTYVAVEGPGLTYNGPAIPDGRALISVEEGPKDYFNKLDLTTFNIAYDFENYRLSYNLGHIDAGSPNAADNDSGNAITNFAIIKPNINSETTTTHEVRFETTGPDRFVDYTLGLWSYERKVDHLAIQPGGAFLPGAFGPTGGELPIGPPNLAYVLDVDILIPIKNTNQAIYGNFDFHLTPKTDFSIGARYFHDDRKSSATVDLSETLIAVANPLPAGTPCSFLPAPFTGTSSYADTCDLVAIPASSTFQDSHQEDHDWTYGATLRHKFTDDFMAYASFGRSWRGGGLTVGVKGVPDDILFYGPESSNFYELGVKSEWLDSRLRVNAAVFQQKFDGYIDTTGFRIPYVQVTGPGTTSLQEGGGFTFNADAISTGGEVEIVAQLADNWSLGVNWATADGHYDDALIPCRDSNNDGVDDADPLPPSYAPPNGQTYATCRSSSSINNLPNWSIAATTEAYFPLTSDREAYVRALATYRPSAQQKGDYSIPGYGIIDLFAGVRTDAWDFGLFARNVLDEEVTLNDPASLAMQPGLEIREGGFGSGYKAVNYRRGRELGVSLRYAFGVG